MAAQAEALDRTYAALADPTRRAILVRLAEEEARISDLADPLPMSFAGVSRHVGVLEAAGLIEREIRGREHWLSLRTDALESAEQWLHEQREFWRIRADALAARLEQRGSR
jgi:DNA-binding transcriptional ArsR family regulator